MDRKGTIGGSDVAKLQDPVGEEIEQLSPPRGFDLRKIRVPIGVIGIIYESRPNVTIDCAILCLKSGNASILRGGKEAFYSNSCLIQIIQDCLRNNHINENAHIVFIHMNDQTEIPLFPLMKNKLQQSLKSHKLLLKELTQKFNLLKMFNFNYHVKISLEEYLEMISNRYMTVLLDLSKKEIEGGIDFIKKNYPNQLVFQDTLTIKVFN